MNLTKLFNLQRELDLKIETQHNLKDEPLIDRKTLALLVEVGELANETRCFKFWSLKPPAERDTILEEYVDGVHFILSLGLELGVESELLLSQEKQLGRQDLNEQFLTVYETISTFKSDHAIEKYKKMFQEYLTLGQLLGFSSEQVEEAYINKNEVNHVRQQQGY